MWLAGGPEPATSGTLTATDATQRYRPPVRLACERMSPVRTTNGPVRVSIDDYQVQSPQ